MVYRSSLRKTYNTLGGKGRRDTGKIWSYFSKKKIQKSKEDEVKKGFLRKRTRRGRNGFF